MLTNKSKNFLCLSLLEIESLKLKTKLNTKMQKDAAKFEKKLFGNRIGKQTTQKNLQGKCE